jgi:hypothetical protein
MMFCWFINVYEKQSSKVQKVVTLISIFVFFSSTTYKKSNEQKNIIDDHVSCYEGVTPFKHSWNIWMKWFELQKDPWFSVSIM